MRTKIPILFGTYILAGAWGEAENEKDKSVEDILSEMVLNTTEKEWEGQRGQGRCVHKAEGH